jgi:hypothetical protein
MELPFQRRKRKKSEQSRKAQSMKLKKEMQEEATSAIPKI